MRVMEDETPSRTAMVVALIRAEHTRHASVPLLRDDWAERLVPPAFVAELSRLVGDGSVDKWLARRGLRANVILRARYCEDQLREAVARGVEQYVIVGAGFDSFAWRRPSWATNLRIFEIDHPATQNVKIERLRAEEADLTQAHFVAADLRNVAIDQALAATDYDPRQRSFFAWLGVTRYLTRDANASALAAMERAGAIGSCLLLSYTAPSADVSAEAREREAQSAATLASWGESAVSAFTQDEMAAMAREAGFDVRADLSIQELIEVYRKEGADALGQGRFTRLMLAERI